MADEVFWASGSIPGEGELRSYLQRTSQLSPEEISATIGQYREQVLNDPDISRDWPQMAVNSWVNQKVSDVMTDPGREVEDGTLGTVVNENQTNERDGAQERFGALTDMARQRMARQSETFYDQANSLNDSGNGYGAGLSTSVALGFRVDEYGNPVLDEAGMPVPIDAYSMWQEIRGLRFNMGELVPANEPVRMPSGRPVRSTRDMSIRAIEGTEPQRARGRLPKSLRDRSITAVDAQTSGRSGGYQRHLMTPAQALAMLNSMDENSLTRLQQEMYEAGLYGEDLPSWGQPDTRTRQAYLDMFTQAAQNTDEPIDVMLNRMADERINRQEALGASGSGSSGASGANIPDFKPEITSEATLGQQVDEIARSLRGEFASPEEKADLVRRLQARELEVQKQNYDRDVASVQNQNEFAAAGPGAEQIDSFMAAVSGQESGGDYGARNRGSGAAGKYQIMPANWPSWAQRAGLPRNAPQTPENQELVARRVMLDYFEQFGNWRDVAVAWYAGPGNVGLRNSTRAQSGGPSIKDYADTVLGRMANIDATGGAGGGAAGGMQFDPIEAFDPAAEAQEILKAQDPAGWQAHEFGERAIDFYQLLGGVVDV